MVYMDETCFDGTSVTKTWIDDEQSGPNSFVPNALVLFRSGFKQGDYQSNMDTENYEKWSKEKLIVNLGYQSMVVIDNILYHNVQVNTPNKV